MDRLSGKVIVVAGAGSGIGAATALRLAGEGAAVVLGDLTAARADPVAAKIRADGGEATSVSFDMVNEDSVANLVRIAVERYGGLDGLHANAADLAAASRDSNALDIPLEIFDRTIAVNLRGHLLCTRHAIPELLKRGGGSIVYTSSAAACIGEPVRVAYAVSKSGLNALMRHVASRWGKDGIRVNAIAPGLVLTDQNLAMSEDHRARALRGTRSQRLGSPDDIAAMVAMLMSKDGEWINGQVMGVDGGAILR